MLCQELLKKEQLVPEDSLFNEDLFDKTMEDIAYRNRESVLWDIDRLVGLAPEEICNRGPGYLKHLIQTDNEGWCKSIPIVKGTRPQPEFSVGLKRSKRMFTPPPLQQILWVIYTDWYRVKTSSMGESSPSQFCTTMSSSEYMGSIHGFREIVRYFILPASCLQRLTYQRRRYREADSIGLGSNVFNVLYSIHYERICSAVDQLYKPELYAESPYPIN